MAAVGRRVGVRLANDTKVRGVVDSFESREVSKSDVDRLESWATTKYMTFNKSKRQILHPGQGHPGYTRGRGRSSASPVTVLGRNPWGKQVEAISHPIYAHPLPLADTLCTWLMAPAQT